jgi:hypothetical protein
MRENWNGNPVWDFIKAHGLTPCQLATVAGVDYNLVYAVLNGYLKRLPMSFIEAIEQLDGDGAGDKVEQAYRLYRDGMAHELMKA